MKNKRAWWCITALALATLSSGCRSRATQQVDFTLGGASARVATSDEQSGELATAVAATRRIFNSVWSEFNEADRASEISKINRMAAEYRLQISFTTFRALDLADYYSRLTGGAYDLTLGPLRELWGFGAPPPGEAPSDEELAAVREVIGMDNVQLSEQGAVSILTPGTRLAAGQLNYAYGTDLAILELRRRELSPVLVAWDDFARAQDTPGAGLTGLAPVRNPFSTTNALGSIDLSPHAALAVADLYKQTVTIAGRRYGGIFNPRTKRPAEGTALVAVRGPTCTMAHVLAQALVVLGREKGDIILDKFPDCEVLIVPDSKPLEIWMTPGWSDHFQVNTAYVAAVKTWDAKRVSTEGNKENKAENDL